MLTNNFPTTTTGEGLDINLTTTNLQQVTTTTNTTTSADRVAVVATRNRVGTTTTTDVTRNRTNREETAPHQQQQQSRSNNNNTLIEDLAFEVSGPAITPRFLARKLTFIGENDVGAYERLVELHAGDFQDALEGFRIFLLGEDSLETKKVWLTNFKLRYPSGYTLN